MKLSIITIHLNQWDSLARTAHSLASTIQEPGIEWIVVDGDSLADNASAQSIRRSVQQASDQYLSEPDSGIYQAMNKGTSLATGDYVLYLNAGDELHPAFDPVRLITTAETSKPGMIWGEAWDRDRFGNTYPRKARGPAWLKFGIPVCHQAVFFDRNLLGTRPYREDLAIAGDYDLLCRLHADGCGVVLLPFPVVIFELTGISSERSALALAEESSIRTQYFPRPAFVEKTLVGAKHLVWKSSMHFPRLRRLWRRWI